MLIWRLFDKNVWHPYRTNLRLPKYPSGVRRPGSWRQIWSNNERVEYFTTITPQGSTTQWRGEFSLDVEETVLNILRG